MTHDQQRGRGPRRQCASQLVAILLAALAGLAGCAQFPEGAGGGDGPRVLLDMRMTLRGELDETAYYLFVIDLNDEAGDDETDGPEVIAPRTEFLGNGRATGEYDHYVEYHLGQFEVFADQPEKQGQQRPPRTALGPPFFFDAEPQTGVISATVDLMRLLPEGGTLPSTIEVNLITVNQILLPGEVPIEPRQTDGFGRLGTDFLSLRPENGLVINNEGIEAAGEIIEGRPLDPAYDIIDFRIAIRTGS